MIHLTANCVNRQHTDTCRLTRCLSDGRKGRGGSDGISFDDRVCSGRVRLYVGRMYFGDAVVNVFAYKLLYGSPESRREQAASLRSALRSSELLMEHSSQNYLEVLTARQSLLQAELDVVTDRFDEIQGVINLYHALGGGY